MCDLTCNLFWSLRRETGIKNETEALGVRCATRPIICLGHCDNLFRSLRLETGIKNEREALGVKYATWKNVQPDTFKSQRIFFDKEFHLTLNIIYNNIVICYRCSSFGGKASFYFDGASNTHSSNCFNNQGKNCKFANCQERSFGDKVITITFKNVSYQNYEWPISGVSVVFDLAT